jgi:hypothetical protein
MKTNKYLYDIQGIGKDFILAFCHFPLNLFLCIWGPCLVLFSEIKQAVPNNRMVIYNSKEEIYED